LFIIVYLITVRNDKRSNFVTRLGASGKQMDDRRSVLSVLSLLWFFSSCKQLIT